MRKTLLAILLFSLIFAAWSPALAGGSSGPTRLHISNLTKSPFTVILIGPRSLSIVARPGSTEIELPQGVYTYSFNACGLQVTGTVVMGLGWRSIGMGKCKYVNQLVKNKTGGNLSINLNSVYIKGQSRDEQRVAHLNFKVSPSDSRIKVPAGIYNYTVVGCGGRIKTGTIRFTGNRQSWTWECKEGNLSESRRSK